jgi:hypothetical protein
VGGAKEIDVCSLSTFGTYNVTSGVVTQNCTTCETVGSIDCASRPDWKTWLVSVLAAPSAGVSGISSAASGSTMSAMGDRPAFKLEDDLFNNPGGPGW